MLWDIESGRPLLSAALGEGTDFAFDASGARIVKALLQRAREFHVEMPTVVHSVVQHNPNGFENVSNHGGSVLEYSRDGRWIATAVWGWVQLRAAATGQIVSTLPVGTGNNYCSVGFAADDQTLLVGSRELGLMRVAVEQTSAGNTLTQGETIDGEKGFLLADLSPDRRRAVLVSMWREEAKVVSLDTSAPAARWKEPGASRAAFLAGGREVLVNSNHEIGRATLLVRDAANGNVLRALEGHTHGYSARVSPDGHWLAVGGSRTLVRVDGTGPSPTLPNELVGPENIVAFSHDGELLAGASGSRVTLLRLRDGEVVAHLEAPGSGTYVPDLAFSPDDAQLSLYFENGTLVQWDLRKLRSELTERGLAW